MDHRHTAGHCKLTISLPRESGRNKQANKHPCIRAYMHEMALNNDNVFRTYGKERVQTSEYKGHVALEFGVIGERRPRASRCYLKTALYLAHVLKAFALGV